ncbi:MAG TPA: xanthine dehydrogenase [Chloroflexi bacterium]|nr:xanthine dehydrogenase [Chloroflexota bacterium]|tara:strand:+ start:11435 stop:13774 length:2340 start_codon:yes stop_codon:yes gene_type:complete
MKERQFFGKSIVRNEDPQLLTGQALFVDDVNLPDMVHAAFVRSTYAHAKIVKIDVSTALNREGVVAVYTAEDLGNYWQPGPLLVQPPPIKNLIFNERTQVPLAKDKVRFVGEPVVMVLAENRYIAEDALMDVYVEYEPLSVVADLATALDENAGLVHDDLDTNLCAHVVQTKGDYELVKSEANCVIKKDFIYDHGAAAAMENRGVVASWDRRAQRLTVWDTTQAPIPIRNGLASMLNLSEHQVRVIAPFIGGGFGPKIMMFYQEEVLIPWVSMQINRPVKWIEDRSENFYATTQERSQIHTAEIALDEKGIILGVSDKFLHDAGAYAPYGLTVPINSQCTLLGPYHIPNYYSEFSAVFTNFPIVTPYRGAGRQHGVFVIERLLDMGARKLGIDRAEIRFRNFIKPDQFPYDNQIIYQDFAPLVYDSGNYAPAMNKALDLIEYDNFVNNIQPQMKSEGRYVGLGIVAYVEGTGIGPYEGARVQVQSGGKVTAVTGVGTQGQGHFTSFAQIVADQLGVEVTDVDIVTGDTDQFYWGAGTFASRGAVVAGNAFNEAARDVRAKALKMATEALNAEEEIVELVDGVARVQSDHSRSISLGDLASRANPMRGAVKPGTEPGLEATNYFGPERGATANGVHAMIVEVDPETMLLDIKKYIVVHDCGEVINPLILAGQIQGGVAQGIGNAFYEKLLFDENGQLLNASFMDYLLPTSLDVPNIEADHVTTPSPLNPLGIKGAGEAGAIPVGPLFAQAIEDAIFDVDFEISEIPLSPSLLWEIVQSAK